MKILDVAAKTLKESFRQPQALGITLGLPLAFMLIFGLAFGGSDSNATYAVRVSNADEGDLGAAYVEGLRNLTHDDGTPLFDVTEVGADDAAATRDALESRDAVLHVAIPANFTAGLTPGATGGGGALPPPVGPQPGRPTPPSGAPVAVEGDPAFADFGIASRIVEAYSLRFGEAVTRTPAPVRVETSAITSSELTSFDFIAPGLMVFAILNLAPQAASVLAREVESRTIDRVRLSPLRSGELLAGVALGMLVMAAISLALMLATARLMGFHNQGSYAVAYAIALGAAFSVVGLGMVIASFAKTQQEAANVAALISVPASFLSGSFFAIPGVDLFTWRGTTVELYDVLPTTHAVKAMREVMTFGSGLEAVAGSVLAILVLAGAFFAIGVGLFRARRLAPE